MNCVGNSTMPPDLSEETVAGMAKAAWNSRLMARLYGSTAVGCAALDEQGRVFVGCNIEHRYRSHDIHAEVNAISSLVAGGGTSLVAIFIAAERERFTPCGSCMDWIFEVGSTSTLVITQREPDGVVVTLPAEDLMPFYPR